MSLRTPRWRSASSEKRSAIALNASQSVRASHGGGIAGLNVWTNGCRSVDERSCFSYHVAAGRTTSEKSPFDVIRKSIVVNRSSFASGASRQVTSRGRSSGGASSARTPGSAVPSMCFRKYSWPLPDDPSRFARQTVRMRGWLPGASGSSQAKRSDPSRSFETTWAAGSTPAFTASSTRSRLERSKLGNDGIHPSRAASATMSGTWRSPNAPVPSGEAICEGGTSA